jgi:site-specific recombinase XerD
LAFVAADEDRRQNMPKVYAGDAVFESMEDYLAAMEAWEQHRAPFKAQAEALVNEFIDYLYEQGLSERTVRKHGQNIGMFVVYLTEYTGEDDFASVGKGTVNTNFFRWYRRKVLGAFDQASLKSSTRKFFQFLAERKDIHNEKVLGKRKK